MSALGLLVLIFIGVSWIALTYFFGEKTYDASKKIYNSLTDEETKGEQKENG